MTANGPMQSFVLLAIMIRIDRRLLISSVLGRRISYDHYDHEHGNDGTRRNSIGAVIGRHAWNQIRDNNWDMECAYNSKYCLFRE